MTADGLTLATRFDGKAYFEDLPQNRGEIEEFRSRLLARNIFPRLHRQGSDVVLSYRLSIADALAIGYNETVADELRFALEDAFPELKSEPENVAKRIREMERLWGVRRRKAS